MNVDSHLKPDYELHRGHSSVWMLCPCPLEIVWLSLFFVLVRFIEHILTSLPVNLNVKHSEFPFTEKESAIDMK